MKILHLARFAPPHIGGVETHLSEINKILSKKHEIKILSAKDFRVDEHSKFQVWIWVLKHYKFFTDFERFDGT